MRRFGPLALLLLLSLALVGAGPIRPKPFPPFGKGKRAEVRSWKTVQLASKKRDAAATLQRAQSYLSNFPEGPHRTEAHLLAGRAALDQDFWPTCRHHLDSYLKQGGREDVQRVSFQATLCRAREGKDAGVVTVLRNIVVNSEDERRATKAGRELVAYHLLKNQARPAFEAQALLLERGLYIGARDLRDSRRAARDLSDSVLDAMQKDAGRGLLAGVFAFLELERSGGMEDGEEGEKARRTFLYGFPEHPLSSLIPDAEELLRRPLTGPPKVGVLLPLTGRFEVPGNNARRGIAMALADLRDAPDTPLAELELILFDTEGSAERAVEGARKLASENGVLAILGPIIGDEAEAVGDIADELRVPIMMNSQRGGVTEGHPTVFNNWVSPEEQVDAALEYITTKMAVDSFAIAYPERETAARMVERFWTGLEERGGRVSFIEPYADGTTDFTKVARRFTGLHYFRDPPTELDYVLPFLPGRSKPQIESMPRKVEPGLDFEAFFVPDHFRAMSMLAPGFVAERINLSSYFGDHRGLPIPIIGGAALNHPSLLQRGKRFAEGILLVDSFFSGSHEDVVQRFVLQYQILHGSSPAVLESACYDSARFLFELIERGNLSPEDLVASLGLTTPSASILRSTGFDASREMDHSMLVLQVRDGAFRQIHPAPPENPVRYELGDEGILLAFQKDEEGNKVEVAITGSTHLRLPPREESEGEESEEAEGEKEEADDSKTAAPKVEESAAP